MAFLISLYAYFSENDGKLSFLKVPPGASISLLFREFG